MKKRIIEAAEGIIAYKNGGCSDEDLQKVIEHAIKTVLREAYQEVKNDIANKSINL